MIDFSPERWRLVSPIVDEAIELEPEHVDEFLDRACGDDTKLRQDVERMLEACERAESFLETPPGISVKSVLESVPERARRGQLGEGDEIGHYRIVELIGRGGMGAVYLAERSDGQFEKQVALKVVKRGMDSDEILDRFRKERQILAGLDHPNIATLLDGGVTSDGRPYFVMELAAGQAVDRFCDERRLTIRERLELFQSICGGVQYAHRNLVVHRDLKPSNILVTWEGGKPLVRLLDFGIAKVLDPAQGPEVRTQALSMRLTPEYAAPEQVVNGPTSTSTDVYSLGVILYRLLCGVAPYEFNSGSLFEIESLVCHKVPRRPSAQIVTGPTATGGKTPVPEVAYRRSTQPGSLRQMLAGDLDAITMKALEKEPDRRYGSAAELSADIGRYLEGLPVKAQRQTGMYRLRKFVGRNRVVVALATSVAAALLVGIAATSWQAREAQRQGALRQAEAERAQETRDFVVDVLGAFNPDLLQGEPITAEAIVEQGLEGVEELNGRPELQLAVLNALGQVAFSLGQTEQAEQIFSRAYGLFPPDSFQAHWDVANAMAGLGDVALVRFQSDSAVRWYREALELKEARPSPDSTAIATSMIDLSFALQTVQDDSASLRRADSLLALAATFPLPDQEAARRWEILGDVRLSEDSYAEAELAYGRAERGYRDARGDSHPDLGKALLGLGRTYFSSGRSKDAVAPYEEAIEIFRQSYGDRHFFLGMARLGLGDAYRETGAPSEAARYYSEAIDALDLSEPAEAAMYRSSVGGVVGAYVALRDLDRADSVIAAYERRNAALDDPASPNHGVLSARLDFLRGRLDVAEGKLSELLAGVQPDESPGSWVEAATDLLVEIRRQQRESAEG
jgi:serine/threonine protein kinase